MGSATAPLPLLSHYKDTTPENRRVDQCGSMWISVDEKGSNGSVWINVDEKGGSFRENGRLEQTKTGNSSL